MLISEENIRLKIRNKIYIPLTASKRRKNLRVRDFTIISNNCWGGMVYESYGIMKMSPTVGMFIMPEDFIKFVRDIRYYIRQPLVFIEPEKSKWKKELEHKKNWNTYLIACLGDIELHMLHYHDIAAAKRKWETRISRINYQKLIFKMNDQNGCTERQIREYMELPLKNRLCFVASRQMKINDEVIFVSQPGRYADGIKASREPFGHSKYIDLTEYINGI